MIDQMSKVASSPVIAIVAAGATLVNPGALMPLALKDISETNPSTGQYIAEWVGSALVSLLPSRWPWWRSLSRASRPSGC